MKIIQTRSYKLAIITEGNPDSNKIALLLPGRLDTKDYINFISHMKLLASLGFYAITLDPPGTWESADAINFTTTHYINAVNELIEYFGNKPTLLFGHSRGGHTAMIVGCKYDNVIGIVVVNASFGLPSSPDPQRIKNGYLISHRDLPPGDRITEEQKEFHLSLEYFEDGYKYDPLPKLKECKKPKLIIYSIDDEWSKPQEPRDVFKMIPEPKMIYEMPGEHDYRRDPARVEEVNFILGEFIRKYL